MVNKILTEDIFAKLLELQRAFDSYEQERLSIKEDVWQDMMYYDHTLALNIAKANFIEACRDKWMYYDLENFEDKGYILDTASTYFQFIMLNISKLSKEHPQLGDDFVEMVNTAHDDVLETVQEGEEDGLGAESTRMLLGAFDESDLHYMIAEIVIILGNYGMTFDDLVERYTEHYDVTRFDDEV